MLLYTIVDSTKCITLNVLRSTGRPSVTIAGNSIACICVLLPGGYWLSLHMKFGLVGLWVAMSAAWLLVTVFYYYLIQTADWSKMKIDASQVTEKDESVYHSDIEKSKPNIELTGIVEH